MVNSRSHSGWSDNVAAQRRRISLAQLLLWLTLSAIYVALLRGRTETEPGVWGTIVASGVASIAGAAWSGLILVTTRIVRGLPHHTEPGEWLLFVLGVVFALEIATTVWPNRAVIAPRPLVAAITCLAMSLPTLSRHLSSSWKMLFGTLVLLQVSLLVMAAVDANSVIPISQTVLKVVNRLRLGIACTLPVLLSAWQYQFGVRMSWMHWLGVGVFSFWMATSLISSL